MTIEQKMLKAWGEAQSPETAIWILKDGTFVNGCMDPYGRHRNVDHSEVNQFYKRSKFEDPGSSYIYLLKTIRRGNIRMSMDGHAATFELYGLPTKAQWRAMGRAFVSARRLDKPVEISVLPRRRSDRGNRLYGRESYMAYLSRYAPHMLES